MVSIEKWKICRNIIIKLKYYKIKKSYMKTLNNDKIEGYKGFNKNLQYRNF